MNSKLEAFENPLEIFNRYKEGGLDFLRFIAKTENKTSEHSTLDFKTTCQEKCRDICCSHDRAMLAKAIGGFANTHGGVIVMGVDCRQKDGLDIAQGLRPISQIEAYEGKVWALLNDGLEPKLQGSATKIVYEDSLNSVGYLIIYVPESCVPIGSKISGHFEYFQRIGSSFSTMTYAQMHAKYRITNQTPAATGFEDSFVENLIEKVRRYWIEPIREVTNESDRIPLVWGRRPDLLFDPVGLRRKSKTSNENEEIGLTPSRVFRTLAKPRALLLTGRVGAGKTAGLVELAADLLGSNDTCRNAGEPVPLLLRLDSWSAKDHDLIRWLEKECYDQYGITSKLLHKMLGAREMSVFLDGLDEVDDAYRTACTKAVDSYLSRLDRVDVVITCSESIIANISPKMHLQSALAVQPLNHDQIVGFLQGASKLGNSGRPIILNDEVINLATTPLMLKLLSESLSGAKEIPDVFNQGWLWETYVERMLVGSYQLKPGSAVYQLESTERYLRNLASNITKSHKAVITVEGLQPAWLPKPWIAIYFLPTIIFCGLAMYSWFLMGLKRPEDVAVWCFSGPVLTCLACMLSLEIEPFKLGKPNWRVVQRELFMLPELVELQEKTRWTFRHWKEIAICFVCIFLLFTAISGLDSLHIKGLSGLRNFLPILATGFAVFLILPFLAVSQPLIGFIFKLITTPVWVTLLMRTPNKDIQMVPNRAIWISLRSGCLAGCITVGFTLPLILLFLLFDHSLSLIGCGQTLLFTFLLAFGWCGGLTFLKHFWLRFLLSLSGQLPWRVGEFFEYLVERSILVKQGVQFSFEHILLLQHLSGKKNKF